MYNHTTTTVNHVKNIFCIFKNSRFRRKKSKESLVFVFGTQIKDILNSTLMIKFFIKVMGEKAQILLISEAYYKNYFQQLNYMSLHIAPNVTM